MTPVSFIQNPVWISDLGARSGAQHRAVNPGSAPVARVCAGETSRQVADAHDRGTDTANVAAHDIDAIADRFVRARLAGVALADFPGSLPASLDEAYACQDAAIARWPAPVAGWKVGYIAPSQRTDSTDERLVGPIFADNVRRVADAEVIEFPVIDGGFAAVEGEFVFRLAVDAPARKMRWSAGEAATMVAAMHVGIEMAGSPLATINALGPRVVVSDFGNNGGLLIGPEVADWRAQDERAMNVLTFIEDIQVGEGSAASIDGGPLAALAFALSRNARRGRPLRAGDWITTGAVTGIHDIVNGQQARVDFGPHGQLHVRAVNARNVAHRRHTR